MVKYKQIMQVSLCGNIERDALKAGEELPGAKLVAGYRLAVR